MRDRRRERDNRQRKQLLEKLELQVLKGKCLAAGPDKKRVRAFD